MGDILKRMKAIGMSQVDLIYELKEKGIDTQPGQLSYILRGLYTYKKADIVLKGADEILKRYEYKRNKTG